jgi:hypothetical protein
MGLSLGFSGIPPPFPINGRWWHRQLAESALHRLGRDGFILLDELQRVFQSGRAFFDLTCENRSF